MQQSNPLEAIGTKVDANDKQPYFRLITKSSVGDFVDIWGLNRVLERKVIPNDFVSFQCYTTGKGVDVFVVDSGIRKNHFEFLPSEPGVDRIHVLFDAFGESGEDHLGHGTHIASIIAGQQVGVAPAVDLHIVKVFDRELTVDLDRVIEGLDRILQFHKSKKSLKPSIVNLSFVVEKVGRLDFKIQELIAAGVVVVCAAGNRGIAANSFSPAHLDHVITVGASTMNDSILTGESGSNFGSCVDLLAPGETIEGANATGDRSYFKMSGTSPSAAYVSGVCACYLEKNPKADPIQVRNFLVETSTKDQLKLNNQVMVEGTPNRILFNEMQKLNPRWVDNNTTLVGIFYWGQEAKASLACQSRTDSAIKFEIVDGQLPSGLHLSDEGIISGKVTDFNSEMGDKSQYFTFLVRANDKNGCTDRLFYCIATDPALVGKEDFTDSYVVELAKVGCSGSSSS